MAASSSPPDQGRQPPLPPPVPLARLHRDDGRDGLRLSGGPAQQERAGVAAQACGGDVFRRPGRGVEGERRDRGGQCRSGTRGELGRPELRLPDPRHRAAWHGGDVAAAAGASRQAGRRDGEGDPGAGQRQDPARLDGERAERVRGGPHRRGVRGCGADGARAHARAALLTSGGLGRDRAHRGGAVDPGDRQRRPADLGTRRTRAGSRVASRR